MEFRSDVKTCLQNAKKPKSNLGEEQRNALRELREDDSMVILPAGKVISLSYEYKETYAKKVELILNKYDYEAVKMNPIPSWGRK